MTEQRVISWFSRGAASAVATKLVLSERRYQPVTPVFCETGSEHPDNERFAQDCEKWFGVPITRLKSTEYQDTWDVWEKRKYIAGVKGAPCTTALKVIPRLGFQRVDDIHIFGYTADKADVTRAAKLRETFFELTIETPLIQRGITKAGCFSIIEGAGIKRPITYDMGLPNANCLPCPKATSPAYWALIREKFPADFNRMAELSRRLGARLARVKNERVFIDEIPANHPTTGAIVPSCDFLCLAAEAELADEADNRGTKP